MWIGPAPDFRRAQGKADKVMDHAGCDVKMGCVFCERLSRINDAGFFGHRRRYELIDARPIGLTDFGNDCLQ